MQDEAERIAGYFASPGNPYNRYESPLQFAAFERGYREASKRANERIDGMIKAITKGRVGYGESLQNQTRT